MAESTGIAAILEKLTQMDAKLNQIEMIASSVSAIESELAALKTETTSRDVAVRSEIDQLRNLLSEEKKRSEQLEKEMKQQNLIIYNLKPANPPLRSIVEEAMGAINHYLPQLSLTRRDFKDVFRLGTIKPGEVRPILVKFNNRELRDIILRSGRLLKNFDISVAPDYTYLERKLRQELKPMLNDALSRGQDAKLRGTRLLIEGQTYYYDQVTCRVELLVAKPRAVPRSPAQQVTPQVPRNQKSQTVNFGASTSKNAAWPDLTHKMVTRGKAKRGLESIISPEDAHKTGNRSVRKNSTTGSYSEITPVDQPIGSNSPPNGGGGDSSENISDEE